MVTTALPRNAGPPFYEHLNRILGAAGFAAVVEGLKTPPRTDVATVDSARAAMLRWFNDSSRLRPAGPARVA